MHRLYKSKNSIEDALVKEDIKYISINYYKDSVFPNDQICKLKNIEGIAIHGGHPSKRKNIIEPHKLIIDTNRLKQLPNLKYLYISFLDLSQVPVELCYFKQLKGLAMEVSFIDSLPNEISKLENLEILTLRINYLSFLPKSLPKLKNLKVLNLTNNRFRAIPAELCLMENLAKIDLGNTEGLSEQKQIDSSWPYPFMVNYIDILAQKKEFTRIITSTNLKEIVCGTSSGVNSMTKYSFDKKLFKKVWLQTVR